MKIFLNFALLAVLSLFSCTREDPFEREKKEIQKFLNKKELLLYRGLKLSLRSLPPDFIQNTRSSAEQTPIQKIAINALSRVLQLQSRPMALTDIKVFLTELKNLKKQLEVSDEDQFPPLINLLLPQNKNSDPFFTQIYNSDLEHMILGSAWMSVPPAPPAFSVYEFLKINTDKLDPITRAMSHFLKGIMLNKNSWNYSAEKEFDQYLHDLETNAKPFVDLLQMSKGFNEENNPEKLYSMAHAPGVFMRGFCRYQTGRKQEAQKDFEIFVGDVEKSGIDNEAVWGMRAYIEIGKENKEESIKMLDKLYASDKLEPQAKEVIQQTKGFLQDRQNGKALNKITDKIFIAKIVSLYAFKQLNSVDWYAEFQKSEAGQKLTSLTTSIHEDYQQIMKYSPDSLKEKGKEIFNR